jgi:hypothetical protein
VAHNARLIEGATADDVFAVLEDGCGYAEWVVGTRMIRRVEPGWPRPGTAIHYTAGWWPLRKDDKTQSLGYEPRRELRLEARAWPAGTVGIRLAVEHAGNGVQVTLDEAPARGWLRRLHNPALDALIKVRNVETLRRLEKEVRRKQHQAHPPVRA